MVETKRTQGKPQKPAVKTGKLISAKAKLQTAKLKLMLKTIKTKPRRTVFLPGGGSVQTLPQRTAPTFPSDLSIPADDKLTANAPTNLLTCVPTEEQLQQSLAGLPKSDRRRATEIRTLIAGQLGSDAAARVWLYTAGGAFAEPPVELVKAGKTDVVLAYVKSQAGAAYA